ncbi:hypothetical protein Dimus_038598 [Dionaea muscipula]
MHCPTVAHMEAAKRILRYLKGTIDLGLLIQAGKPLAVRAFSDADWAGCPDTRRSITGFAIFLGPNLISWGSKKQATVSRSSAEAEYRAIAVTATEVLWFTHLLQLLGISLPCPPVIFCDSDSAVQLSKHSVFHSRTKHIDINVHFVREKVRDGILRVSPIPGQAQVADAFTKSLAIQRFLQLRPQLLVRSLGSLGLRGDVSELPKPMQQHELSAPTIKEISS